MLLYWFDFMRNRRLKLQVKKQAKMAGNELTNCSGLFTGVSGS